METDHDKRRRSPSAAPRPYGSTDHRVPRPSLPHHPSSFPGLTMISGFTPFHVNRTPAQSGRDTECTGQRLRPHRGPFPGISRTPSLAWSSADRPPTDLVKQGSLDGVDLTLLTVDPARLPVRMRMRRLPLCEKSAVRRRKRRRRDAGETSRVRTSFRPPRFPETAGAVRHRDRRCRDDRQFRVRRPRRPRIVPFGDHQPKDHRPLPAPVLDAPADNRISPSIRPCQGYPRLYTGGRDSF